MNTTQQLKILEDRIKRQINDSRQMLTLVNAMIIAEEAKTFNQVEKP